MGNRKVDSSNDIQDDAYKTAQVHAQYGPPEDRQYDKTKLNSFLAGFAYGYGRGFLDSNSDKEWVSVEYEKPLCYETGDWDGKRSDLILCMDNKEERYIARCYEGNLDGEQFFEWCDKNDFGLRVEEITHWIKLP